MAPFLELNFFAHGIDEVVLFRSLVETLVSTGAQWSGEALVRPSPEPFASPLDDPVEQRVVSLAELREGTAGHVVRLSFERALDPDDKRSSRDIVTYVALSAPAARTDPHPVALWSDGEPFVGPTTSAALRRGRVAYRRFVELVSVLLPSYAAITVDYGLESPTDLRRDPRSLAFADFYIARSFAGDSRCATIRGLFDNAYVEDFGHGLYLSSSAFFNPSEIWAHDVSGERALRVAETVAAAAR